MEDPAGVEGGICAADEISAMAAVNNGQLQGE